jgi:hypothetical protein
MPVYQMPLSALVLMVGLVPNKYLTQVACTCRWETITKVSIQASGLFVLVISL